MKFEEFKRKIDGLGLDDHTEILLMSGKQGTRFNVTDINLGVYTGDENAILDNCATIIIEPKFEFETLPALIG